MGLIPDDEELYRSPDGRLRITRSQARFPSGVVLDVSELRGVRLHEHQRPRAGLAFGPFGMARLLEQFAAPPFAVFVTTDRGERRVFTSQERAHAEAVVHALRRAIDGGPRDQPFDTT